MALVRIRSQLDQLVEGRPKIDFSHWLARGLSFFFMPGVNLTQPLFSRAYGAQSFPTSGFSKRVNAVTPGVTSSAQTSYFDVSGNTFQVAAATTMLMCWFHDNASFVDGVGHRVALIGDSSATNPVFDFSKDTSNNWRCGWIQSGGIGDNRSIQAASNIPPLNGQINTVATTYAAGGNTFMWWNGVKQGGNFSPSPSGPPSSVTSAHFWIAGGNGATQAFCQDGIQSYIYFAIWDKVIPDIELQYLGLYPFAFLAGPTVYNVPVPPKIVLPSAVFRKTFSQIGGRTGSRQQIGWGG